MIWLRLAITAAFVSGATACTHTYTPEELQENRREQARAAESAIEYDEQVERTGGTNAELLRDGAESVVEDSDR